MLAFRVLVKPNKQIKYLSSNSSHSLSCFKAINTGVCHHLTKLTSIDKTNGDKRLSDLYPRHFDALDLAKLVSEPAPTLADHSSTIASASVADSEESEDSIKKKHKEKDHKRAIYFSQGWFY